MCRQAGGGKDATAIPCTSGSRHPLPPPLQASDPNTYTAGRGRGRGCPPAPAIHCQNLGSRFPLTNATSKPKASLKNFVNKIRTIQSGPENLVRKKCHGDVTTSGTFHSGDVSSLHPIFSSFFQPISVCDLFAKMGTNSLKR